MSRRFTTEEFIEKASSIHKNTYNYEKVYYLGRNKKITIICNTHGEFTQRPADHLTGSGCFYCGSKKWTLNDFIKKANKVHQFKFDYSLVEYKDTHKKVKIICPLHREFLKDPRSHLLGSGCPKCFYQSKKTSSEQFENSANLTHQFKFDYRKVRFNSLHDYILIGCSHHGFFKQKAYSHLYGIGCPICSASKGETKIFDFLTKMSVEFISQYKIQGCKNQRSLIFDFAILNKTNLKGIIEFNGEQHYKPSAFGSKTKTAEEIFKQLQKRDNIKYKFCAENNIPLLIIPYQDMDQIDLYVNNFLKTI